MCRYYFVTDFFFFYSVIYKLTNENHTNDSSITVMSIKRCKRIGSLFFSNRNFKKINFVSKLADEKCN